jgi:hypothetical protein
MAPSRRASVAFAVVAGFAFAFAGACGGDSSTGDGGADGGPDGTLPDVAADVIVTPDAAAEASDAAADVVTLPDGEALCDGGAILSVSKIDPTFAWTGAQTPIAISGTGFVSTPTVSIRNTSTQAIVPLLHAAFISSTSINAIVPTNVPIGTYDVLVTDPIGCTAYGYSLLTVVANPPPEVLTVSPATGTTQNDTPVTITGCHFPASPGVDTVDSSNNLLVQTAGAATCTGPTNVCADSSPLCTMTATILTKTDTMLGAYVVRVINKTDNDWGDWATFVVTDPSGKLNTGWVTASSLVNGRRSLGVTSGRIDNANRFLYALGGEDKTGVPFDSVEVAALDKYGQVSSWFVEKNHMKAARSGLVVLRQGKFIYAIGGTSSTNGTGGATPSGTPLDSIERAIILDPNGAPMVGDPTTGVGSLAAGTYYYVVSAMLNGNDAYNPNGETLASDEVVATVSSAGSVTLSWPAVTNAVSYKVYRSPAANGASQSEVILAANVTATNDAGLVTFTDDGSLTPGTEVFMPKGSTGVWLTQSTKLQHARMNAAATIAPDPSGQLYAYVLGGYGTCSNAAGNMNCYERATLDTAGDALGSFVADTSVFMVHARNRFGAAAMTAANGPSDFTTKVGANTAFVLAGGGEGISSSTDTVEYALVTAGGGLKSFSLISGFAVERDGSQMQIANGYAYQFLGGVVGQYRMTSDLSTTPVLGIPDGGTFPTLGFGTWSNAGTALGSAVGRHGVTLESAYFYVVGGTSSDTDALSTVYQIIY